MAEETTAQNLVEDNSEHNSENELVLLQQKADEYLDGWKRAKADYLNYKKETEVRQREVIEFANARLIADLLPIYEHFKMAVRHVPADQAAVSWVQGFSHVLKQMQDFLKNLGIEEIKTVGEKFNPEFHESIESVTPENDHPPDMIMEEVQAGYTLQGKVVMPAKVKVTK